MLVDTGASLCALKRERLPKNIQVTKDNLKIRGIAGTIFSDGHSYLEVDINGIVFEEKFHVFQNLSCTADGIIGQNFLQRYKGLIDFEQNRLTLTNFADSTHVPLFPVDKCSKEIVVPARCETFQYISTNLTTDCVIQAQQLCEGVFLAGAIAKPINKLLPIKILNTRDEPVKLHNCTPVVHSLQNYECFAFEKDDISANRVKELFKLINLKGLQTDEQLSIERICAKYADIFHLKGDKLTTTNLIKQDIHLKKGTIPIYKKPYRLPQSQKAEIDKQIKDLLDNDIIEEAQSNWSSPLLIVPKKPDQTGQKKFRVVVDYRLLNQNIEDNKFPLPNISQIMDSLSGSMLFTKLDLAQGFYQVELNKESRPCTAFTTDKGMFQMKRLPMGLKISPNSFSQLMTIALSGLNYESCFVYLDDLIVFGRNLQNHNSHLIEVFERLRKVNLKLNPAKCEFLKREILYLGHVITPEGILPDPEKVKALKNYPEPKNADEVKRFVAFANYYRKYIPQFAQKTHCLNQLTRRNVPFIWTEECKISFNLVREALMSPPVLDFPDFSDNNEFILQTDASKTAIGAVLSNGNNKPIAYCSRSLSKSEMNYAIIELELLAIVHAVKFFRCYLFGRKFKILTDHKPLIYLFSHNNPSSRLTKFRLLLSDYDFTIEYIRGSENFAPDALSRIILTSDELKNLNTHSISAVTRAQKKKLDAVKNSNDIRNNEILSKSRPDHPKLAEVLKKDKECTQLVLLNKRDKSKMSYTERVATQTESVIYVPSLSIVFVDPFSSSANTPDVLLKDLESLCRKVNIKELTIIKEESNMNFMTGLINKISAQSKWTGPRINIVRGVKNILDKDTRKVIMNDFHLLPTSGHAGINRMTNNVKKYYFWPGMTADIKNFVLKCESCQKNKYGKYTRQPMQITTTAKTAFEKIYLDIVGPIQRDNHENAYILTIQCELSKFIEAYPLKSKETIAVANAFVKNFILRFGIPTIIATDRGCEFLSSTMEEVCKLLRIEKLQSTAYHHQSIGALENSHKHLNAFLRIATKNQTESWSSWVPYWCFAYNTTVHSETDFTPFELVFGKLPSLPSNLDTTEVDPWYNTDSYPLELKYRLQTAQNQARETLINNKLNRKTAYDKHCNPLNYKPGDLILVKSETGTKITKVYEGPYEVISENEPNVEILKNDKRVIIHKNRTKRFLQ